jgi:hypothetical protein
MCPTRQGVHAGAVYFMYIAIGHRIDFGYEYIEKVLKMHAHAVLEILPWTSPA